MLFGACARESAHPPNFQNAAKTIGDNRTWRWLHTDRAGGRGVGGWETRLLFGPARARRERGWPTLSEARERRWGLTYRPIIFGRRQSWPAPSFLPVPALPSMGVPGDAELLLVRMIEVPLSDSAVRKDVSRSIRKLRLPETIEELGPPGKMDKLRQASTIKDKIDLFSRTSPPTCAH